MSAQTDTAGGSHRGAGHKTYTDVLTDTHTTCMSCVSDGARVLEFGCGGGVLTRALRDDLHCIVTGFEASPEAAARARQFAMSVVVGDIEDDALWARLSPPYDVAIFADVLEHLRDPGRALARCRTLLVPNGQVLIAVPNVAHYSIRLQLLRGRFRYVDYGILDDTHLRFFTRETLCALVEKAGYRIGELRPLFVPFHGDGISRRLRLWPLKKQLNRAFARLFPDAAAFKWFVRCQPHSEASRYSPMGPRS